MGLLRKFRYFSAGLLFSAASCTLTQKMGSDDIPTIRAPNSKVIHKAIHDQAQEGLVFHADKRGDLYSQPLELKKEYALQFMHETTSNKDFVVAFNPEGYKYAYAQRMAYLELNEKTIQPEDLKIIHSALRNYHAHAAQPNKGQVPRPGS